MHSGSQRTRLIHRPEEAAHTETEWQAALLGVVTESTGANLAYLDRDFNFVWVNSAYAEKSGYTREELLGRNHFDLFPHEENQAIFERVRDTGEPFRIEEKPFEYPKQPERGVTYWDWTLTPVKDADGVVHGLVLSLADVTEKVRFRTQVQQLAARLADERRFLALILDHIPMAVAYLDENLIFRQCNAVAAQHLGRPTDRVIGQHLHDVIPAGAETWGALEHVLRTGESYIDRTISITWPDRPELGEVCYLASLLPDKDSGGTIHGVFASAQDITKLVNAQRQLEAERGQLEAILASMADGLIVFDAQGYILDANPAALRILGSESVDDVRRPLDDGSRYIEVLYPDGRDMPVSERPMSRVLRGEAFSSLEAVVRRRDKEHIVVASYSGTPVRSSEGQIIMGVLTVRDVTERKRAEEELARERAHADQHAAELESFFSSMADGAVLFDVDGSVVYMNEAPREILDIPAGESREQWWARLRFYTLDGEQIPLEQVTAYRALAGETLRDVRYRVVTPWGVERILSTSASPIRDGEGRIIGAAEVFRDVTESAELERRREELLEREHHIAEVLQEALVPAPTEYDIPGWKVAVNYYSAQREAEIGGDFYDIVELGDGLIGILVGDVAGKGLQAAIRVAAARYAIRSYARLDPSPAAVMTLANEALTREQPDGLGMLTVFYALVDTRTHMLTYTSGGHEPPVLRDSHGNVEELRLDAYALGVFTGFSYPEASRELRPGDTLVMLTDGITEARRAGEYFGEEGVIAYLAANPQALPDEIVSGLLEAAKTFAGGSLRDDAVIVAIELVDREQS